jgi:hypothetical protein
MPIYMIYKYFSSQTIETVKKSLQGFYVFLSEAKEQPRQGFTFRAVDLIKELDSFLSKDYKTDYQFMVNALYILLHNYNSINLTFIYPRLI